MESLDRVREKMQGIGEWTDDENDDIQGIPDKGTLDESISSDSDSFNEEIETTTHGDEGMKIVEDYLARYTTLYDRKRAA